MICTDIPLSAVLLHIVYHPFVNVLGAVNADHLEMDVTVIECIVFGFPVLRTVIGIRASELIVEELGRLRIISALLMHGVPEATIIMIAESHLKRNALNNALHSLKCAVPLNFMLATVCVVAARKNKSCIGIFLNNLFENSRKI